MKRILHNYAFQIVIVGFGNFHIHKSTLLKSFIRMNYYLIINFYTIKFSSTYIPASFLLINNYLVCFSDLFSILFVAYLLLYFHYFLGTALFFFCRNIICQFICTGAFFVAICENTYTFEALLLQEIFYFLYIFFCFAGEARY